MLRSPQISNNVSAVIQTKFLKVFSKHETKMSNELISSLTDKKYICHLKLDSLIFQDWIFLLHIPGVTYITNINFHYIP